METFEFTLKRRICNYREARESLLELKEAAFPPPCVILVETGEYLLIGAVTRTTRDEGCERLAVLLENGNTVDYPLESCTRIDCELQWPNWIRKYIYGFPTKGVEDE